MSYKLQFIDSARSLRRSLSNVVDSLAKGIHKIKCKNSHNNKKCVTCGIKCKYCEWRLECRNVKIDSIEYKCLCCNRNLRKNIDEKLKKQFVNIQVFSDYDTNKYILLLQKGIYPNE